VTEQPLLSIIITSYTTERLKDIAELLDSISTQTYPDIETIFVTERSAELFNKAKMYVEEKHIPNVRVIFSSTTGASSARNLGVKHAGGDILSFVDDDVVLFPNWAERIVETYIGDKSIMGVTGPALLMGIDGSISWFPKEFYWVFSGTDWCDWNETRDVRNVWTMNASFRREALLQLHGPFLSTLGPKGGVEAGWKWLSEDMELSLRVRRKTGKRIVYNPEVKVWHKAFKHRPTWRHIIQCSYWIGRTRYALRKLYYDLDREGGLLATEYYLLRRIFIRLFPSMLRGLIQNPVTSLRQLSATIIILFVVAAGYCLSPFIGMAEKT